MTVYLLSNLYYYCIFYGNSYS